MAYFGTGAFLVSTERECWGPFRGRLSEGQCPVVVFRAHGGPGEVPWGGGFVGVFQRVV